MRSYSNLKKNIAFVFILPKIYLKVYSYIRFWWKNKKAAGTQKSHEKSLNCVFDLFTQLADTSFREIVFCSRKQRGCSLGEYTGMQSSSLSFCLLNEYFFFLQIFIWMELVYRTAQYPCWTRYAKLL